MCGICGVFSTTFAGPEIKAFRELFILSSFRGEDSSGILSVERNQISQPWETSITKGLGPSPVFINFDETAEAMLRTGSSGLRSGLVGHCRAATKGTVSDKNAHPFVFSYVAGVHNGTIIKSFKGTNKFDTDSEALYKLINDEGIEAALNEIESVSSAYALVYFDKRTQRVHCIRNDKRPLWFTYFYGTSSLMFASERWMLDVVAKRHSFTANAGRVFGDNPDKLKMFTLSEHTLFSFKPNSPGDFSFETIKVKKPIYSTYVGGVRQDSYWKNNNNANKRIHPEDYEDYSGFSSNVRQPLNPKDDKTFFRQLTKAEKKAAKKAEREAKKSNVVSRDPDERQIRGRNGAKIYFRDFEQYCLEGCCMCGEIQDATEDRLEEKIGWYDDVTVVCETCLKEDWVKQYLADPVSLKH